MPHLKAALNILNGSEPEAGAENVVESKDGRQCWSSLRILDRTVRVGKSADNDVDLMIYDVSPEKETRG